MPEENLFEGEDFSQLISTGAAILAQDIAGIDGITQNITNVRMGVKVTDGMTYNKFELLIPENVPLPYSATKECSLFADGQRQFELAYYEHDVKNYPKAIRVDEDGMEEVDRLLVENLPEGLKKNQVRVKVFFEARTDGSMDIRAELVDLQGRAIANGSLKVQKESDLE